MRQFILQNLTIEERLGVDKFAPTPTEANAMFNKYDKGKYFSGNPTCRFRDYKIPWFIAATPKESITLELLRNVLQQLDHIGTFKDFQVNLQLFSC